MLLNLNVYFFEVVVDFYEIIKRGIFKLRAKSVLYGTSSTHISLVPLVWINKAQFVAYSFTNSSIYMFAPKSCTGLSFVINSVT